MLELALTFNRSLGRLPAVEQAAAKQIVFDYMADATRPGLSLHRIDRVRDKRFWTIRVNRDLRIVVFKDGARSIFCYVGHHDDAYSWAERRKFEVHAITGAAQMVEIAEIVREEIRVVSREAPRPGVLAHEDPKYLLSLGVPETYLDLVRSVDDEGAAKGRLRRCFRPISAGFQKWKGIAVTKTNPGYFRLSGLLRLVSGVGTAGLLVVSSALNEEKASPILSIKRRTRFG
jgi:hypothetical protein